MDLYDKIDDKVSTIGIVANMLAKSFRKDTESIYKGEEDNINKTLEEWAYVFESFTDIADSYLKANIELLIDLTVSNEKPQSNDQ